MDTTGKQKQHHKAVGNEPCRCLTLRWNDSNISKVIEYSQKTFSGRICNDCDAESQLGCVETTLPVGKNPFQIGFRTILHTVAWSLQFGCVV